MSLTDDLPNEGDIKGVLRDLFKRYEKHYNSTPKVTIQKETYETKKDLKSALNKVKDGDIVFVDTSSPYSKGEEIKPAKKQPAFSYPAASPKSVIRKNDYFNHNEYQEYFSRLYNILIEPLKDQNSTIDGTFSRQSEIWLPLSIIEYFLKNESNRKEYILALEEIGKTKFIKLLTQIEILTETNKNRYVRIRHSGAERSFNFSILLDDIGIERFEYFTVGAFLHDLVIKRFFNLKGEEPDSQFLTYDEISKSSSDLISTNNEINFLYTEYLTANRLEDFKQLLINKFKTKQGYVLLRMTSKASDYVYEGIFSSADIVDGIIRIDLITGSKTLSPNNGTVFLFLREWNISYIKRVSDIAESSQNISDNNIEEIFNIDSLISRLGLIQNSIDYGAKDVFESYSENISNVEKLKAILEPAYEAGTLFIERTSKGYILKRKKEDKTYALSFKLQFMKFLLQFTSSKFLNHFNNNSSLDLKLATGKTELELLNKVNDWHTRNIYEYNMQNTSSTDTYDVKSIYNTITGDPNDFYNYITTLDEKAKYEDLIEELTPYLKGSIIKTKDGGYGFVINNSMSLCVVIPGQNIYRNERFYGPYAIQIDDGQILGTDSIQSSENMPFFSKDTSDENYFVFENIAGPSDKYKLPASNLTLKNLTVCLQVAVIGSSAGFWHREDSQINRKLNRTIEYRYISIEDIEYIYKIKEEDLRSSETALNGTPERVGYLGVVTVSTPTRNRG